MIPRHINTDAFNGFRADVTAHHIFHGVPDSANHCAVALALDDAFTAKRDEIGDLLHAQVTSNLVMLQYESKHEDGEPSCIAMSVTGLLSEYIDAFDTYDSDEIEEVPPGTLYITKVERRKPDLREYEIGIDLPDSYFMKGEDDDN